VCERYRLQYPIGRVLYGPEPPTWLSGIEISRRGDLLAFAEHPVASDTRGGDGNLSWLRWAHTPDEEKSASYGGGV